MCVLQSLLGDGIGDALLEHILSKLASGEGLDLALKWLYALFSCEVQGTEAGGPGPPPPVKSEEPPLEGRRCLLVLCCHKTARNTSHDLGMNTSRDLEEDSLAVTRA
jgi:hypothetical protein